MLINIELDKVLQLTTQVVKLSLIAIALCDLDEENERYEEYAKEYAHDTLKEMRDFNLELEAILSQKGE